MQSEVIQAESVYDNRHLREHVKRSGPVAIRTSVISIRLRFQSQRGAGRARSGRGIRAGNKPETQIRIPRFRNQHNEETHQPSDRNYK